MSGPEGDVWLLSELRCLLSPLLYHLFWCIKSPLNGIIQCSFAQFVYACRFVLGSITLRSWFLAHGADPNITDDYGHSPLTVAAACAPVSFLEQLLEHGGDPARSNALHEAVGINGAEGIEKAALLLDYGAPINIRQYEWDPHFFDMYRRSSGFAPLHIAVGTGNEEMVALLVDRGADPLVEDRFGLNPLTMARSIQEPRIVRIAEMLQRAVGDQVMEL